MTLNQTKIRVPVSAFALQSAADEEVCDIMIQNLPSTMENPSQIVLGSMFLQLFVMQVN